MTEGAFNYIIIWFFCSDLPSTYLLWWTIYSYFAHFPVGFWSYYGVLRICYIMWIHVLSRCKFCKYFLLICGFSFYPINSVFHRFIFQKKEVCNFDAFQFIIFVSFMNHIFGVISKKSLPSPRSKTQIRKIFFYAFLEVLYTFRSDLFLYLV